MLEAKLGTSTRVKLFVAVLQIDAPVVASGSSLAVNARAVAVRRNFAIF